MLKPIRRGQTYGAIFDLGKIKVESEKVRGSQKYPELKRYRTIRWLRWIKLQAKTDEEAQRELDALNTILSGKTSEQKATEISLRYGVSKHDKVTKLSKLNGNCPICGGFSPRLCRDHCHRTGVQRKYICNRCNVMLGMARDDINTLQNAIQYLNEFIR